MLAVTVGTATVSLGTIWIGLNVFDMGLYWCWSIMAVWLFSMCFTSGWRFLGGRWRDMRVIEHVPADEAEHDSVAVESGAMVELAAK